MPKLIVTIEAGKFLDQVVRPFADAVGAGTPYAVFRDAVIKSNPNNPLEPGLVPANRTLTFDIELPQLPTPPVGSTSSPTPGLQPIDPKTVLDEIAKAIRDAERVLADENLALMTADVEVDLTVAVGGLAGGQAKLRLHIGPVPQG